MKRAPAWLTLVLALPLGLWPLLYALPLHPVSRDAVTWMSRSSVWSRGWADWVFLQSHFVAWRPITALSYALDSVVGGLDPLVYRATDLALHVGCVVAVWVLHRALLPGARPWGALASAAMVLLHPVVGLVVPHLARRSYPLSTLLALLGVLALVRLPGARGAVAGGVLLVAGGLANESGYAAIPAALLLVWLRASSVRPLAPAVGLAALAIGARTAVLGGFGGYDVDEGAGFLEVARALAGGLVGLDPMRTGLGGFPTAPVVAFAGLTALALGISVPRDAEARRAALFAAAWLGVGGLLFLPQGVFFPRQVYVLLPAWALLVGVAVSVATSAGVEPWRRGVAGIGAGLAFAGAAWQSPVLRGPDPVQVFCWTSNDRLVRDLISATEDLPPRARVDAVVPHYRRPHAPALRARDRDEDDERGGGKQALAWVRKHTGARFGETAVYRVGPDTPLPAARLDDGTVLLVEGVEWMSGTPHVARTPGGRLYFHDGLQGRLLED